MTFWNNIPGTLGICLEYSNVNFGHQGALSASQCDSGTTCTISTGSRLYAVKIWWRSELWFKSYCDFCQSACLDWNILTETSSIVLCLKPVLFLCLLWRSCFISCLHSNKEKSSNIAQTASVLHQGVSSKHPLIWLPPCNITWTMALGTMRHLLALMLWAWNSHEAGVEYNKNARWHVCLLKVTTRCHNMDWIFLVRFDFILII